MPSEFGHVEQVIVCDDIRQEINQKFLIVGMYNADIVVGSMPANINLRAFVQYRSARTGFQKLDFMWKIDDTLLAELEGGVSSENLEYAVSVALPSVGLHIQRPGLLRLIARHEDGTAVDVAKHNVKLSDGPIPVV